MRLKHGVVDGDRLDFDDHAALHDQVDYQGSSQLHVLVDDGNPHLTFDPEIEAVQFPGERFFIYSFQETWAPSVRWTSIAHPIILRLTSFSYIR